MFLEWSPWRRHHPPFPPQPPRAAAQGQQLSVVTAPGRGYFPILLPVSGCGEARRASRKRCEELGPEGCVGVG